MARLLVVDDDHAFRLSTAALLRADGHEVDVAPDASAAVLGLGTGCRVCREAWLAASWQFYAERWRKRFVVESVFSYHCRIRCEITADS